MLTRYEKFLEKFDKRLDKYFEEQCEYVKCKMGCSYCCEVGEYPFSPFGSGIFDVRLS